MPRSTRKRLAVEAASPVSGLAAGVGAILFSSQDSQGSAVVGSQGSVLAADAMDSQDGSQQYSQPEYFSGDFCTPEDQVADLGWSQEQRDAENSEPNSAASSAVKMCPPTPDSAAKRRKTKQASGHMRAPKQAFMYELDALPEDEEEDGEDGGGSSGGGRGRPAPGRKAPPTAPAKGKGGSAAFKLKGGKVASGAADARPRPGGDIRRWMSQDSAPAAAAEAAASPPDGGRTSKDRMESASPTGSTLFADTGGREGVRRSSGGTKVGVKACRRNPFLATPLTDKEKKMPSRPLPRLGTARASRYLQDFEELAMLGQGNFGSVSLARSRIDGATYAIKRKEGVRNDSGNLTKQEEKAMREVWAMAATVHVPYVVRYHGAWCEENQLFIQMEACECHIKERYLGKNPGAATLLRMIEQIGTALAGLHELGLGHLDVKPDNIYCSGPDFRLGDFGLACSQQMVQEGVEPEEGDGRYASPQVIQGFSQLEVKELAPCDVYSLGASVLELAYGRALSCADAEYAKVRDGAPVELADSSPQGQALARILTEMLQPSAEIRIDCVQAVKMAREALSTQTSTSAVSAAPAGAVAEGDVDMSVCGQTTEARKGEGEGAGEREHMMEEIRRLKAELQMRTDENRALRAEKHVEMLHNSSYSSQRSDAEPQGSQESPVRCFAQPMPTESPIPSLHLSRRSPRSHIFPFAGKSPASAAKASPAPIGASPGIMSAPPPRPPTQSAGARAAVGTARKA